MSTEGPNTRSVRAREPRQKAHDAVTVPIVPAATFAFADTAEIHRYFQAEVEREEYGRYGNPTVRAAEAKIAALDGAEDAALFASGMAAATTTLLALLKSGQHLVMTSDCYRRTRQFALRVLAGYGIETTSVEPNDLDALKAAIRPGKTRVILTESPTNPYLRVVDLPAMAEIAYAAGAKLLVDATFATPINQQPLTQGADLVIHSATKYLGGHHDLLAGALTGSRALLGALKDFRGVLGGVLDPHSAYLLVRGLKTLALRVTRQNETALALARWLEAQPQVAQVWYPGLPSHPDHAIAARLMRGFGGVVTFRVRGGLDAATQVVDRCRLATIAPSLGGVDTLIEQPALMSYYELTTEQREALGIHDDLIRLAVGIEDEADLRADLAAALGS